MTELIKVFKTLPKGNTPIFVTKHGSHLYGLDTPESDVDYKGVYMPSVDDLILNKAKHHYQYSSGKAHEKNTKDDIDIEWMSLHEFLRLLDKGEMTAVDMLFASSYPDAILFVSSEWQSVLKYQKELAKNNYVPYVGYIKKQVAKYGIKGSRLGAVLQVRDSLPDDIPYTGKKPKVSDALPYLPLIDGYTSIIRKTLPNGDKQEFYEILGSMYQLSAPLESLLSGIDTHINKYGGRARDAALNKGVDWKAVSHAFRAYYQLLQLIDTGSIKFPFTGSIKQFLLEVKRGERTWEEIEPKMEAVFETTVKISQYVEKEDNSGLYETIIFRAYDRTA